MPWCNWRTQTDQITRSIQNRPRHAIAMATHDRWRRQVTSLVRAALLLCTCSLLFCVNTVMDVQPFQQYQLDLTTSLNPETQQVFQVLAEEFQRQHLGHEAQEPRPTDQLVKQQLQQRLQHLQQQVQLTPQERILLQQIRHQLQVIHQQHQTQVTQQKHARQRQPEQQQQMQKQVQVRARQRQERKQRLEKQQQLLQLMLLEEEDEADKHRPGRQQAPKPRKPPTSVRDLFRTDSCVQPPFQCPHPRIQFYLYTRNTQDNPELMDMTNPVTLVRSRFNPEHPTKIIIHGFGGGRNFSPSTDLRKAYFTRGQYNIIIVDYSTLVVEPCLSQIEWSPRFCAECIAQMVDYLAVNPRGTRPAKLHLMGYSVGAHIAGLVANHVTTGKLGRITGLDPTIIFYMGTNRSRDLDPSDAHFVDVIHTGAGILGQWGPNGHVDFYVNGGSSQPGCQHNTLLKTLSCDHTKVTPYFIESINSDAGFWASPCSNQFLYFIGWCTPKDEDYILMGEHVPHSARGLYYLTTNAYKPYAKGFPGQKKPSRARGNS